MTHSFNLVDQPWIPVVDLGVEREISIRGAFVNAAEVELSLANPLEMVAILRQVLIPVYLRATDCPHDEEEWADRLVSPDVSQVLDYLDVTHERFELFHANRPFAQVAGLRAASGGTKPSSLLRSDLATGNNVPLFGERTEATPPHLTPAQAARALLATQAWDTAAIKTGAFGDTQMKKGKTTGNPVGPLGSLGVVIPWGRNLWETLVLNAPMMSAGLSRADTPQWEAPAIDANWRLRQAEGLLDLLTWQSRRIRLIPTTDAEGGTVVTTVIVCAGDRLQGPIVDLEPHTLWKMIDPKNAESPQRPRRHPPGKSAWRGLDSILATEHGTSRLIGQLRNLEQEDLLPRGLTPEVLTVGVVYGNQSAVIEEVITDTVPLPLQALREEAQSRGHVLRVVDVAEEIRRAANHLQDDLRRAAGVEPIPWDKGSRTGDVLMTDLDIPTRRFLRGLQRHPEDADDLLSAWMEAARREAERVADTLSLSAPPTTFLGRDHQGRRYRLSSAVARYRATIKRLIQSETELTGSAHA